MCCVKQNLTIGQILWHNYWDHRELYFSYFKISTLILCPSHSQAEPCRGLFEAAKTNDQFYFLKWAVLWVLSRLINVPCPLSSYWHKCVPHNVPPAFFFYYAVNFCYPVLLWVLFLNRDSFLHEIYNLPLDITPTSLLQGFFDTVCPSVISTVNSFMATGAVLSCF